MRFLSVLKYDILFQFRHGFYYAGLFVCFLYVALLRFVSPDLKTLTAIVIIFSDPLLIGLFFIGAMVLLEKEQNTFSALFITPLNVNEFFLSRIVSLGLLSLLLSSLVVFLSFGLLPRFYLLALGVFWGSMFFTLIGMVAAFRVNSLNGYIISAPLYVIIFFLPVLKYLDIYTTPLYYLLPSTAVLLMISSAFRDVPWSEICLSLFVLATWTVLAYNWARRWFEKYVLLRIGG